MRPHPKAKGHAVGAILELDVDLLAVPIAAGAKLRKRPVRAHERGARLEGDARAGPVYARLPLEVRPPQRGETHPADLESAGNLTESALSDAGNPACVPCPAEAVLRAVLKGRWLVAFSGAAQLAYLLSHFLPGLY